MRRPLLFIAVVALGASVAPTITAHAAAEAPEARFLELINGERTQRGLRPLRYQDDLSAIAERHSERMRKEADIWHNSRLAQEIPGTWRSAGENVGIGFDTDNLHASFMASHSHRVNILMAAFDEIGLGVVVDPSGEVYVTEVFVDRGRPAAVVKPKPKPKPAPVVKPTPPAPPAPPAGEPEQPSVKPSSKAPFKVVSRTRVDRRNVVELLIRIVKR